jgi:hypothetical protein
MEKRGKRSVVVVSAFVLAATLSAQAVESPLSRLHIDAKKVGWDNIEIGISIVQAERRSGLTLALTAIPSAQCGRYRVDIERDTLRLTLGFPGSKPGAKLDYLFVHFEGYQVLAKRDELVAELKRIAPGAVYFAPAKLPDLAEADAADPMYALPGEAGLAVRVEPGAGLLLTRRDCMG